MSRRRRSPGTGAGGRAAGRGARPGAGAAALGVLVALLAFSPAHAQRPWFQIEVVVVAQGDDGAWQRNNWREEGPPPLGKNTVELLLGPAPGEGAQGTKRRHAFRRLPASTLKLGTVVDRLERSEDYRVLLHVGWHQPGFPIDDARAVHLFTPPGVGGAGGRPGAGGGREGVDGTVRFWRRRFLHAEADLAYGDLDGWRERSLLEAAAEEATRPGHAPGDDGATRPEGPAEAGTASAPAARDRLRVVRLNRSLRLRQGRLHFIDHPLFGLLLYAKRLD